MPHSQILAAAGFTKDALTGGSLSVKTPVDGSEIACIPMHSLTDAEAQIAKAKAAFKSWRLVPAPRRGELVRLMGEELRREKENLGRLVTLECGKIYQEQKVWRTNREHMFGHQRKVLHPWPVTGAIVNGRLRGACLKTERQVVGLQIDSDTRMLTDKTFEPGRQPMQPKGGQNRQIEATPIRICPQFDRSLRQSGQDGPGLFGIVCPARR